MLANDVLVARTTDKELQSLRATIKLLRTLPSQRTVATVEAGSGNFRYTMKFKRIAADDDKLKCSYGRKTGSHKRGTYCRSEEVAREEADAAREFFLEAMRNKN